jgi:hypothetical protein
MEFINLWNSINGIINWVLGVILWIFNLFGKALNWIIGLL